MTTQDRRPIIFGEVLFDCFPDDSAVLGGAPFNVAWNLQAFGMSPLLISGVGDDRLGQQIQDAMHTHGMDTSGLQIAPGDIPTGSVEVNIIDGEPQYQIAANKGYDYIDAGNLPHISKAGLVYHGTLALRSTTSHNALQHLLQQSGAPVFVDVNLRAPWYTQKLVLESLANATWCKLNEDERLELGLDLNNFIQTGNPGIDQKTALSTLFVTRGASGASAYSLDGSQFSVTPDAVHIADTVGAGDAFCSVLILGILHGWDMENILKRAQDFASAVVGIRGAISTEPEFYLPFIRAWNL